MLPGPREVQRVQLGDMYGKQRLLVWTLLALASGTLLAAVSGSLPALIAARIIQGVAGRGFPPPLSLLPGGWPAPPARGGGGGRGAPRCRWGGAGRRVGGGGPQTATGA